MGLLCYESVCKILLPVFVAGSIFLRFYGIIEVAMKVIVKGRENRSQMEFFSIEEFVPADHLLRKIDSAVYCDHIYNLTQGSVLSVNRLSQQTKYIAPPLTN